MKFRSANHNRAARSLAQLVEDKLRDIENAIEDASVAKTVSVSIVNDLTAQELDYVKKAISNAYAFLEKYCEHFEVEPTQRSLKREIVFKAALLWQEVSGATGKSLESYGELSDAEMRAYSQYTTKLTALITDLYQSLQQPD